VLPDRLELHADRSRQLAAADPQGRLLMVSCGGALYHARIALAAQGLTATVDRLPDPGDADLLATLTVTGRESVSPAVMRLVQAAQVRHTDRRPVTDTPVPAAALDAIRGAVTAEGLDLHFLTPDQTQELAASAARAAQIEAADPGIAEELAYWIGHSPEGTGLPASVLPASQPQTTVPNRDFGTGALPIGPDHDRAARYGVLFGPDDEPDTWLQAGEALSGAWLTATEQGLSVLPLSAVIEVTVTREALHRMLAGIGQPFLVLRLGVADPEHAGPPHTPRIPAAQVVDTSAVR
jgi:hypothetical protein